MRLGRVFVSSVFGGMLDLRQRAADAAELLGLEAVLTEEHVAQPGTVREALAREIALSDTYVGLFAQRRGTVPAAGTMDHRAITEEELRLAREAGLRCLVFLSRDGATEREPSIPASHRGVPRRRSHSRRPRAPGTRRGPGRAVRRPAA